MLDSLGVYSKIQDGLLLCTCPAKVRLLIVELEI